MRLILCVVIALLTALPAVARPLSEDEARSLDRALKTYLNATRGNNAETLVKAIPPRIMNVFAGSAGIEASKLEKTLVTQTRALTKGLTVRNPVADESALDATDAALADGTVVTWVVVPTSYEAEKDGKKTLNSQALVALNEAGKWYFVRMDGDQQRQIATIAYPFLAEAMVPAATATPMN